MKRILNSKLLTEKLFKYNFFKKEVQQCKKWNQNLGVLCPICNSSFEIFENFGVTKRANARCKNCGSLERHRLLYFYLTEKFNMFKDKNKPTRILHFAPEKMFFDKFVKNEAVQYTPCDLHPKKYNFDGKTKVLKVDITNIPFEDNSFDFILCNHVLEH
ncbi:MAG: methyltransferase domain-containing protein, partial [Flavobacteriaceae bacterium]